MGGLRDAVGEALCTNYDYKPCNEPHPFAEVCNIRWVDDARWRRADGQQNAVQTQTPLSNVLDMRGTAHSSLTLPDHTDNHWQGECVHQPE